MTHLHAYLERVVALGGSDLHLKAGAPAHVRVDGDLVPLTDLDALDADATARHAAVILDDDQRRRLAAGHEVDCSYSLAGVGRFRVAAFCQRGAVGLVLRRVLPSSQTFAELGLPPAVRRLAEERRGLVLVTGPTGSGKTTTTAALLGHINATRRCHIVTIEDPIEILHSDDQAIVDQREIGIDTASFATALRSVARQDPDVIFIGEMRDLETVEAALQAAATGHLVISTLHTTGAVETINRVVDLFPERQQAQARLSLATSLRGIVCQRLLPRLGGGRVAAIECLVMTSRLHEFVLDPDKTDRISDAIAEGEYYGMQTFDQHLLALLREGTIGLREALAAATSPHDFRIALRAAGLDVA